jgi:hypothetical protein
MGVVMRDWLSVMGPSQVLISDQIVLKRPLKLAYNASFEGKKAEEYRKNRARLIQKIYEVDPLTCP